MGSPRANDPQAAVLLSRPRMYGRRSQHAHSPSAKLQKDLVSAGRNLNRLERVGSLKPPVNRFISAEGGGHFGSFKD